MSMNLIVDSRFSLLKKIGAGSFSNVYLGQDINDKKEVALKLESNKTNNSLLECEAKILRLLQNENGFPILHWSGKEGDFNIMAMDLLGPSLADLFEYCNRKFSLKSVIMLADQMISLIENVHEHNFIHQDIKPENFLIGLGKRADRIYMIDFGLAKKYRDPRTGLHIPFQNNCSCGGAIRYISINSHLGIEQSRRDDLESLAYCLLYFLRGNLPWVNIQIESKKKKIEKIMEIKVATPIEVLCEGFPEEFQIFLNYCRSLKFEERPDYVWLKRLFKNLFHKLFLSWNLVFDWGERSVKEMKEFDFKSLRKSTSIDNSDEISGSLKITAHKLIDLPKMDLTNDTDPFCIYSILDDKVTIIEDKIPLVKDNSNPILNFEKLYSLTFDRKKISNYKFLIHVYDKDLCVDEYIGNAELALSELIKKKEKNLTKVLPLLNSKECATKQGELEITFSWMPINLKNN